MAIEIIIGSTVPTITDVYDSFSDMKNRSLDQIQTSINITNVNSEINGTNYDINITIENTGSVTLYTKNFDVLINGTKIDFTCSKSYLFSKNVVYFNVSSLTGSGQRMLKIITNNGIEDYYEFVLP